MRKKKQGNSQIKKENGKRENERYRITQELVTNESKRTNKRPHIINEETDRLNNESRVKKKKKKKKRESLPACMRSLGVPDLARTSRSTRLMDMRPRVRPDIKPAKRTKRTMIRIWMKKLGVQHSYSTAIQTGRRWVEEIGKFKKRGWVREVGGGQEPLEKQWERKEGFVYIDRNEREREERENIRLIRERERWTCRCTLETERERRRWWWWMMIMVEEKRRRGEEEKGLFQN